MVSYVLPLFIQISYFLKASFFVVLISLTRKKPLPFSLLIIFICFQIVNSVLNHKTFIEPNLLKFCTFLCIPFTIGTQIKESFDKKIVIAILLLIVLNTLLGIYGVGKLNYGTIEGASVGVRGLFNSGNEFSLAYCASISILAISKIRLKLPLLLILTILSLFIATKTTIIFSTLVLFYCSYRNYDLKKIVFFLSPILLFLSTAFINRITILLNRYKFVYEKSDTLINFITSSRTTRIVDLPNLIKTMNAWDFFFGLGPLLKDKLFSISNYFGSFEMDPLDVFFSYGFFGCLLYLYVFLELIRKTKGGLPKYILILFLTISVFAGHLVESSYGAISLLIIFQASRVSDTKL